jgi:hypothetical protein
MEELPSIRKVKNTLKVFYGLCAIYIFALFSNLVYRIIKINRILNCNKYNTTIY